VGLGGESGMSAIQQAPLLPPIKPRPEDEPRVLLHGVSWRTYELFLAELGARPSLRLTYDQGRMELMTISHLHDWYKRIFDRLVFFLAKELKVPIRSGGSATFRRADMLRGLEPDECYWFHTAHRIRGRRDIDLTREPPFELAVEIELSRSGINRMDIHAALGVGEVWRFDGEHLRICLLQSSGAYVEEPESRIFPGVPPVELVRFAHQGLDAEDEVAFTETFCVWVREHILPGWQGSSPSA